MKEIQYLSKNQKGFSVDDLKSSDFSSTLDLEKRTFLFKCGNNKQYKILIFEIKNNKNQKAGYGFNIIGKSFEQGDKIKKLDILEIRKKIKSKMLKLGFNDSVENEKKSKEIKQFSKSTQFQKTKSIGELNLSELRKMIITKKGKEIFNNLEEHFSNYERAIGIGTYEFVIKYMHIFFKNFNKSKNKAIYEKEQVDFLIIVNYFSNKFKQSKVSINEKLLQTLSLELGSVFLNIYKPNFPKDFETNSWKIERKLFSKLSLSSQIKNFFLSFIKN